MRRIAFLLAGLLGAPLVAPVRLHAQVLTQAQIDSVRADSVRRADSLTAAIPDRTEGFLDASRRARVLIAPLPLVAANGTLPSLTRFSFTRDSLDWATAQTVSDLLMRLPGVMIERGGSFGHPELPNYRGRGAASVEYSYDGVPFLPAGEDSTAIDPSFFSLVQLERIDVETGLGLLRVHLYSRRHDRELPRTRIGIGAGDQGTGRYSGSFERRSHSGFGMTLAAEYFSINGPSGGAGGSAVSNGVVQFSWFRNPRLGAQLQYLVQAPNRDALLRAGDTISPQLKGTRGDAQLRAFWRPRDGDSGPSINLFLSHTTWSNDLLDQSRAHAGVVADWRTPLWSSEVRLWHHSTWTPLDLTARGAWSPNDRVTGSMEFVLQRHTGDRSTRFATGRLGVRLPYDVRLTGTISDGQRVQSPALPDDPQQRFTDMGWSAAWQRPRYGLTVGYTRNDAWRPEAYRQLYRLPALAPMPRTEWATLQARYAMYNWLAFETVYEHPLFGHLPSGSPPHHAVTSATVRSKFLRNFPSTVFDLKLQAMMESWSPGIAGLDTEGEPVAMPGRTFFRAVFQLQIGPFIAYYDRVNLRGRSVGYLPGYPLPALSSTFGVRWAFLD